MLFEKIKLEDDEQILLLVRRHWFVFVLKVLGVVFTALAPFILLVIVSMVEITSNMVSTALSDYSNTIWFASALWLLLNWMTLAYLWTDYYLDIWVVTDRRIISIDQRGLFVRSVGSFRLERLQDMNIVIPGFLATMLDYGHIEAQTASGAEEEFQVRFLPHPREIKSLILEAADNRLRYTSTRSQLAEGM